MAFGNPAVTLTKCPPSFVLIHLTIPLPLGDSAEALSRVFVQKENCLPPPQVGEKDLVGKSDQMRCVNLQIQAVFSREFGGAESPSAQSETVA